MRTTRFFLAGIFIVLFAYSSISKAEDIDLYSGLSGASGIPNVLIVIDNAANFDATATGTCTYTDAPATTVNMLPKLGGLEQCALNNVIDALPTNADGTARVNIGMMVYDATGIASAFPSAGCASSNNGGCLIQALSPMTAANKTSLKALIKSWTLSSIKANGEGTALAMQESWAYYAGQTGASGRSYAGIKPTSGCQKNFVIFLGNAYNNVGTPGDGGSASPSGLLTTAGATTTQQASIPITYAHGAACNTSNPFYTMPSHNDSSGLYADEWSRFMSQTDIYGTLDGVQNITTYAIAALGPSCKADYPALLTSMAGNGGGKYFAVDANAADAIVQAFLKILNEVQAVNSVFASSSLPVSVNTQGTFDNQIFIGMFRPDAGGNPRWLGNLKQYQVLRDPNTGATSLGDSLGNAAVSSASTGFISPNAISFWTCGGASANPDKRTCSPVADPTSGFWVNLPQSAGGAYDLPDGELVEKGGAAQVLRLANLTDDYTTSAGTSTNPRKLYTYCPSGVSCVAALSDSANAFATNNVNIAAAAFGTSTTVAVSSIVRTGTSALVTTSGNHGFSTGDSITISGATQAEYNVTKTITVNSSNTFTITGLPDYPTTPSAGAYIVSLHNSSAQSVSTITRTSNSFSTANTETATVTTSAAHGFTGTPSVTITGASSPYSGTFSIATIPTSTTFTYSVPVYPVTPAVNTYSAVIYPRSVNVTSIIKTSGNFVVTAASHGFHNGQIITIAGTSVATYNATWTVSSVTTNTFQIGASGNPGSATGGTASTSSTPVVLTSISRTGTTVAATATATGATASAFTNGDLVNITVNTGSSPNENAYVVSGATITCSGTCTSFTYPITVTPALAATGSPIQVALAGVPATIPATKITRSGTTATVTGVANTFLTGNTVDIATSGTVFSNESAYTGTWSITCTGACSTSFTFGPVTLTPTTPATTTSTIIAYRGGTAPDSTSLINWVRGQDNYGDEVASPGSPITIRPSIHGDVLHSRPVVINYGGTTGVVAFYGSNDGVFHAVNGNQTNPTSSTLPVPGSELWGFIPTEFFNKLSRQRTNSPQLKLSTTPAGILPAPQTKDYFADGATGVYQEVDASGTTTKANIYITMRRGGNFIYALNVLNPTSPQFLWKKSNADTGFSELGETWSRPLTAKIAGYANAVLIFGAGYDAAEDTEPPGTDTQGRGIFIVDADTGALVWSATHQVSGATSCSGSTTQASCLVSGMDYSIPTDITLIDHDGNGKIDRLYAVDTGGNVWRVDLEPTAGNTPDHWQIKKLAALGCNTGVCATPATASTTPRKFFFPPDVVPASGYDAVLIGSGDREHPLMANAAQSVTNRFYSLSDFNTGKDFTTIPAATITEASLFDASSATYNGTLSDGTTPASGFYITLATGEKVVNAPATVAGVTSFGTNQPRTPSATSCDTSLGIARIYRISPFTGNGEFSVIAGGGLPPTAVYGLVNIIRRDADGDIVLDGDGNPIIDQVPFCIGCGGPGGGASGGGIGDTAGGNTGGCAADYTAAGCGGADGIVPAECGTVSFLDACKAIINASTDRHRTYWYLDKDQ
jgi:type IV pilus assembly protein PilY1